VIEADPEDPQQAWAVRMDRLLHDLHTTVQRAQAAGDDWLEPSELAGYRAAYAQIITLGNHTNPGGTIPTGKRGVIRQTPARNLLVRLDRDREHILRFAHDLNVPFNNLAERDIRMVKLQQKSQTAGARPPTPSSSSPYAPTSAPPPSDANRSPMHSPPSPHAIPGSQPQVPNHPAA